MSTCTAFRLVMTKPYGVTGQQVLEQECKGQVYGMDGG